MVGDRGTQPGNLLRRIAYLERVLAASTVDVGAWTPPGRALLRALPNPARGRVRFTTGGAEHGWRAIYGLHGALGARVPLAAGTAEWNARDRRGAIAPSGMYHARLEGAGRAIETRFMLIH